MKNILFLSFLLLWATGTARAQSSTEICADPLDEYKLNETVQRGGLHMTSIGAVKALVVFVQFAEENRAPESTVWPLTSPASPPEYFHTFTDTIFAGLSIFGVARSTDNGYNWSTVGLVETEVFALGISREQNVFAGTWLEGVYRSSSNGETWVSANLGLPQCHPWNCPVKSFAFDSSGTIFACPQGAGIYYSTNNGDLWLPFPSPAAFVQSLAVHGSGSLFAGSDNGIYRSTNNGSTWSQDTIGNVTSISINNSGHIFAGTFGNGVFRSTDVGNTWVPVNSGLTNLNIQCITVTPQGFVFVGTTGAGVFRTVESTNSTPENNWTIPASTF